MSDDVAESIGIEDFAKLSSSPSAYYVDKTKFLKKILGLFQPSFLHARFTWLRDNTFRCLITYRGSDPNRTDALCSSGTRATTTYATDPIFFFCTPAGIRTRIKRLEIF